MMDRFAVINEVGQLLDQGRHDAHGAAPLAAAAEIDSDVNAAVQLAAAFRGPTNGPVRQTSPNTAMTPLATAPS